MCDSSVFRWHFTLTLNTLGCVYYTYYDIDRRIWIVLFFVCILPVHCTTPKPEGPNPDHCFFASLWVVFWYCNYCSCSGYMKSPTHWFPTGGCEAILDMAWGVMKTLMSKTLLSSNLPSVPVQRHQFYLWI